jgi:hypothetical protein
VDPKPFFCIPIFFGGLECVGHSFAYIAQFVFFERCLDSNQLGHPSPSHRNLAYLFRKYEYDSLKIEHHAHGAKTSDPVINKENNCSQAKGNKRRDTGFYFLTFPTEDLKKCVD